MSAQEPPPPGAPRQGPPGDSSPDLSTGAPAQGPPAGAPTHDPSAAAAPAQLARFAVSAARRRKDRVARASILTATVIALIPLGLIVYYLLRKGLGSWSTSFFSTDPTGNTFFKNASIGGIKSAILGTLEIVALASALAIPLGVGVAVWLVEYGRESWFAHAVRFFVDVLTGVPSIVFGLFVYIVLIVGTGSSYAGYKGSFALALLMLPVVTRSAEVILLLVPGALREAALALGAPRWRVIWSIVLPTALPGLVTGVLLAIARAAGETAPLLFTAAATLKTNFDLGQFMNSLPVQIYNDVTSPTTAVVNRAWGAALTLVAMILLLNLTARLVSRRSRLA
jgi:phosphate transport system permease protein